MHSVLTSNILILLIYSWFNAAPSAIHPRNFINDQGGGCLPLKNSGLPLQASRSATAQGCNGIQSDVGSNYPVGPLPPSHTSRDFVERGHRAVEKIRAYGPMNYL
ncbi:hypothetical protein BDR07DRAFT_1400710, partial [Suillus spraguei]